MLENARRGSAKPEAEVFLTRRLVLERYSWGSTTLHAKIRRGEFPGPEFLHGRPVWRLSRLVAWEAEVVTTSPQPRASNRNLRHRVPAMPEGAGAP